MIIKKGNKIKVEYEGKFSNGEVFDSSTHGDHSHPLEFEVGTEQVIKGFEEAVIGMKKDEEKEFRVSAKNAYDEHKPQLIRKFPKDSIPVDQEPKEGMIIILGAPDGRQFPAKIVGIDEKEISIDLNHPLAGKELLR